MPISIKQAGVWKEAEVHVKHLGSWKRAEVWVKQGGVWKQSSVTVAFTPDGGDSPATRVVINQSHPTFATVTLSCTETAVWTWTRTVNVGTANVATGGSATSFTMGLTPTPVSGAPRSTAYTVSATAGGITRYWLITLSAGV